MLQGLYDLHDQGEIATLDLLRSRLEPPALAEWVIRLQDVGLRNMNRSAWFAQILAAFRQRRATQEKQELQNQLQAVSDYGTALELLRQLQNH
jgi:hypothetical protein